MFYGNTDQITPNQYSPSLMKVGAGSGKRARRMRGFHKLGWGQGTDLTKRRKEMAGYMM